MTPSQRFPQIGSVADPEHCVRVPWGFPTTALQTPMAPALSHASHWPVQLTLQQTPSAQEPDVHSEAAAHVAPLGLPAQLPPVHLSPGTQSVSEAHVVLHLVLAGSQRKGEHAVVVVGEQLPVAVHADALAADAVPTHAAGAHVVPVVVTRHEPAPLQTPSELQTPVPIVPHSLSGSAPSLMFSQRPSTL